MTAISLGETARSFSFKNRVSTDWVDPPNDLNLPADIVEADINGDGLYDSVVLGHNSSGRGVGAVFTALSGPNGQFVQAAEPVPPALANADMIVTVGDTDGDDRDDLLVAARADPDYAGASCGSSIPFYHPALNRVISIGDGSFKWPTSWSECGKAKQVRTSWDANLRALDLSGADTNGDGLADFLVATNGATAGSVTLVDDVSTSTGPDPLRWAPADVDGDGLQDLTHIRVQGKETFIEVLLRRPSGYVFHSSQLPSSELSAELLQRGRSVLRSWKLMDVNGDGKSDFVYASCISIQIATARCRVAIETFISTGIDFFERRPEVFDWDQTPPDMPMLVPMDVNGDGRDDLVHLSGPIRPGSPDRGDGVVRVLLGQSDGGNTGPDTYDLPMFIDPGGATPLPGVDLGAIQWRPGDTNGDHRVELVDVEYVSRDQRRAQERAARPHPPGASAAEVEAELNITRLSWGDGSAWTTQSSTVPVDAVEGWENTSPADTMSWRMADLNADGAADLFHVAPTPDGVRVHTLLAIGSTTWKSRYQDSAVASAATGSGGRTASWHTADVNKDGLPDLLHADVVEEGNVRLEVLIADGAGGWYGQQPEIIADTSLTGVHSAATWRSAQLGTDGAAGLVRVDGPTLVVSTIVSQRSASLVRSVTTDRGGVTRIEYGSTSEYARSCSLPLGFSQPVVSAIIVDDGRQVRAARTNYRYLCPHWSQYHRTFLGYSTVLAEGMPSVNRPSYTREADYAIGDECLAQPIGLGWLDDHGGWIGEREITAYFPPGTAPSYDCHRLYVDRLQYGSLSTATTNAYTYYNYDDFGNVRLIVEHGAENVVGDERTTSISYRPALDSWIVSAPWQEVVSAGLPGSNGPVRRSTYYCYDGNNGTEGSNCPGMPSRGALTTIQRVDEQGLYANNAYEYDAYGNIATDSSSGIELIYDPAQHVFPEIMWNAAGQKVETEWNPALGQPEQVTDSNSVVTAYHNDEFGRIETEETPAVGSAFAWSYLDWGDPAQQRVREVAADGTADGLWSETKVDGLGRPYETARESDLPGVRMVQRAQYADALPVPWKTADWSDPDHLMFESFWYDGAGRLQRQEHPDGQFLTHWYDTDATGRTVLTTSDELQQRKSIYQDSYGRVVEVVERDAATAQTARIQYSFDSIGDLLKSVDPIGMITSYEWDPLGRLRVIHDPNLGTRSYTYYKSGDVKSATDAAGKTTTMEYDALHRPKVKTFPDHSVITWRYDEPGHGASRGHLTSVSDLSATDCPQGASEDLTYAADGTVSSQSKCVLGRSYVTGTTYDPLGRIKSVTYPDKEIVTYNYGPSGRLRSMPGYIDSISYDTAGRINDVALSNGTSSTYTYEPHKRWLETQTVDGPEGRIFDAGYKYWPTGLLKSSTSSTNKMNLTYEYDQLQRLRTVSGDVNAEFRYDEAGRMTYNSLVGTYAYPSPTADRTRCLGRRNSLQPCQAASAAGDIDLDYDPNGNLSMSTEHSTGLSRAIDWTYDQQPRLTKNRADGTASNTYDYTGTRVSHQQDQEEELRFNDFVEYSSVYGLVKNYLADSSLVARRDGRALQFIHTDGSGSVRAITDGTGRLSSRWDYLPFGERLANLSPLGSDGALVTAHTGFAGGRTDVDMGLTDMGARQYDAHTGQFISPDSIVPEPLNSQAMNRYSYVYNNPASYVDPSGHEPVGIHVFEYSTGYEGFSVSASIEQLPPPPALLPLPSLELLRAVPANEYLGPSIEAAPPYYDTTGDRQRLQYWDDLSKEYPGATTEMLRLISSAQQVNRPWKWLNSIGEAVTLTAQWLRQPSRAAELIPSGRTDDIGSGDNKRRGTPYNPLPKAGDRIDRRTCERCVTSLIDAIQNEGFVKPAQDYRMEQRNEGLPERVLATVRSNTGVDFGDFGEGLDGRAEGDYLLFTRWADGYPNHVTFGWRKNGRSFYYDPQSGSQIAPSGYFKSIPIIYQK